MTAVAAPYDDLFTIGEPLTETLVDQLGEEALDSLLLLRFRGFLARGHGESEALLLAVGYAETDLVFVAEVAPGPALVLQ